MRDLILSSLAFAIVVAHNLKYEVFHYKTIRLAWPSAEVEKAAIKSGQYIPKNNIIAGSARWRNKLFITLPRWKIGGAATLGYINLSAPYEESPKIIPYPDWSSNTLPTPDRKHSQQHQIEKQLYSVTKCRLDGYNKLFVLDTGMRGILRNDRTILAVPALMIYDLETDRLVRRYVFKSSDSYSISTLLFMVLDTRSADDTDVYVSDLDAMGLICYSLRRNDSWRIVHNFMYPDSMIPPFYLHGITYVWPAGIHSMYLSCDRENGYRTLYFHPFASTKLFKVSTEYLQNVTYANSIEAYYKFEVVGDTGPNSVLLADAMDCDSGIAVSAEIMRLTVSCWNSATPFDRSNLKPVLRDGDLLDAFDITRDDEGYMWIVSFPPISFLFNRMNPDNTDFRILRVPIDVAIEPCLSSC